MNDDHIPVPADHAPRKETHYLPKACDDMKVLEVQNGDAWITMDVEHTVKVLD